MRRAFVGESFFFALVLLSVLQCIALAKYVPEASPQASSDLICHTADPADCYPAIFSPTLDFQTVHDDQAIPPGLHVRMNLATGLKEARLNVPQENEGDDNAIVVLDSSAVDEDQDSSKQSSSSQQFKVQQAEQGSERIGNLRSPSLFLTQDEDPDAIADAWSRVTNSGSGETTLHQDLTLLLDVAHDAEWGLAITQDPDMAARLIHLIGAEDASSSGIDARSAATIVLATAMQNNKPALKAFIAHGQSHSSASETATRALEAQLTVDETTESTHFASRLVFLMAQLCRDESQLKDFLDHDGLAILNELLAVQPGDRNTNARGKLQIKIANFFQDFAATMVKHPRASSQLTRTCRLLRFNKEFRLQSEVSRSAMDAYEALHDLLGNECD